MAAGKGDPAMMRALRQAGLAINDALKSAGTPDSEIEGLPSALRSAAAGNVACDSGCGGAAFLREAATDPALLQQKAQAKVHLLAALDTHLADSDLANVQTFTSSLFRTADGNVGCDSGCGGSALAEEAVRGAE